MVSSTSTSEQVYASVGRVPYPRVYSATCYAGKVGDGKKAGMRFASPSRRELCSGRSRLGYSGIEWLIEGLVSLPDDAFSLLRSCD